MLPYSRASGIWSLTFLRWSRLDWFDKSKLRRIFYVFFWTINIFYMCKFLFLNSYFCFIIFFFSDPHSFLFLSREPTAFFIFFSFIHILLNSNPFSYSQFPTQFLRWELVIIYIRANIFVFVIIIKTFWPLYFMTFFRYQGNLQGI